MARSLIMGNVSQTGAVGEFELIDPLGQGGMGVVWRARHRDTGEVVAIKMVSAPVEGALDGLRREIRALAMIDHPGVIRVVAEGVIDGQPWYAMELLDGTSLRKRLAHAWGSRYDTGPTVVLGGDRAAAGSTPPPKKRPAVSPRPLDHTHELLAPMIQLCDALAHVHAAGLVHRDLTPDNVFLRRDGTPVLVDFGLVSRVSRGSGRDVVAVAGAAVGTAPYMAPEQIRGEVVDVRADLYALGCILYEISTGVPPFVAPNVTGVLSHHLFDAPVPPSQRNPEVSMWLDDVILGLLAKDPRERIGSAGDVAAALARGLDRPRTPSEMSPLPMFRPRLAGRDEVLAALEPVIPRLIAGTGERIVVAGPSGVGKTRLVVELAQRAAADGVRVIAGECVALSAQLDRDAPLAQAGALHPLRPLLQTVADRCRERGREETMRLLGKGGDALVPFEPALGQLRGMIVAPPGDPAGARDRVIAALRHVVAELASSRPVLLVLDDLQWADELTLRFLASLRANPLPRRGFTVIATCRDDDEHAMGLAAELADATDGWTRVTLGGLPPDAVREIAADMLGSNTGRAPVALVDAVVELCEGVPFYIAEYLRYAIDDGMVARLAGGPWVLARPVSELPQSPAELMSRRLDRLGDEARDIVAAAAVLGRALDAELLPAVAGRDDAAVAVAVRDLLRQQVLEEGDRGQLRFRHDKLREAAYQRMAPARRRAAHGDAARALEARASVAAAAAAAAATAVPPSSPGIPMARSGTGPIALGSSGSGARTGTGTPGLWPVLAHHWSEANEPARAIEFLERAADHALAAGAYRDTIDFLGRALRHAAFAGSAVPDLAARRARWHRRLAEAAWCLGDLAGVSRHATVALDAMGHPVPSQPGPWARTLGRELVRRAWRRVGRGDAPAVDPDNDGEAALALHRLAYSSFHAGKVLQTFAVTVWSANLADRSQRADAMSSSSGAMGYLLGVLGLDAPAERAFARALEAADRSGDPAAPGIVGYQHASWQIGRANWAEVERVGEAALAVLRQAGNVHETEVAQSVLAHADHALGRYASAEARCREYLGMARARANTMHEGWALYSVGRERWAVGAFDEAAVLLEASERVLARPAARGDRASAMYCAALAARNDAARGQRAAARAALGRGLELVIGGVPQIFALQHGYAALAEAAILLDDVEALAAARRALWRFASMFPVSRPAALVASAALARYRGQPRRARFLAARGLASARRTLQPRDEVGALRELALAGADGGEAEQAAAVCAAVGLAPSAVGL